MGITSMTQYGHQQMKMSTLQNTSLCVALVAICLALTGCREEKPKPDMGPPDVSVVTLQTEAVNLSSELPGRTSPYAISDVRPQINGIILQRLFTEGSDVKEGQPLYQIDPAPYQASFDQAKAQLAYAEANILTTKLQAERYAALVKINGVSRQDSDTANAAYGQAVALVEEDKAALETAKINLDYTRIVAPISGRVGTSSFTQGALVSNAQTNALTTVQTLDPIYVDITQSTAELLKLRQALKEGKLTKDGSTLSGIKLKLEDGSDYPLEGKLELTDVTVDQTTGSVTLRAIFPNPDNILLPGMYVRATVPEGINPAGILVPQQGVTRDQKGAAVAMIVDGEGNAQSLTIETSAAIGDKWLVTSGLKAGDKVIIEGLQKAKPGTKVNIVPVGSVPQSPEPDTTTPPDKPVGP
jgi:membrane fusion protein (multidrug efflux system)